MCAPLKNFFSINVANGVARSGTIILSVINPEPISASIVAKLFLAIAMSLNCAFLKQLYYKCQINMLLLI